MASNVTEHGGDGDCEKPSKRSEKKLKQMGQRLVKEDAKIRIKRVKQLLQKVESERTPEEKDFLSQSVDEVIELQKRTHRNTKIKDHKLEKEEDDEEIEEKSRRLAEMLDAAKCAVVYTGAGISTAASIPDYRGPNGVWTMLNKGRKSANAGTEQALQLAVDISKAEPTYTHMAIAKLSHLGFIKHIVSQNCDGLHLRSGIPQSRISEIHGNMNVEVCSGSCTGDKRVFLRNYDVTKRTSFRRHYTESFCTNCGSQLKDTIVHFGEKGPTEPVPPHQWPAAARFARKADLIVCIGSSLKILRKYSCLWNMERKKRERPRIVIVNLQWTPKDNSSSLKINGKCDDVVRRVMKYLRQEVPPYVPAKDPVFSRIPSPSAAVMTTTASISLPGDDPRLSVAAAPLAAPSIALPVDFPESSVPSVSSGGTPTAAAADDDDESDTSNDSDQQPPLQIVSQSPVDLNDDLRVSAVAHVHESQTSLDQLLNENSSNGTTTVADAAEVVQKEKAVEVETVPTAMQTERHGPITVWRVEEEEEEEKEAREVEDEEEMEEGEFLEDDLVVGMGEEDENEEREDAGIAEDETVSRSPASPRAEPSVASDEMSASVFRPWANDEVAAPGRDAAPSNEEPKFLTWAEMVAAFHPHNLTMSTPLPQTDSSGVCVETVGPNFVEWSKLTTSSDQPQERQSPLRPSVSSLDRPSVAEPSQSRVSLNVEDDDGDYGTEEEEYAVREGEDDEEAATGNSFDEGDDDLNVGIEANCSEAYANGAPDGRVAQPAPTVPGWMQSMKPRKPQTTTKKRRRITPKS